MKDKEAREMADAALKQVRASGNILSGRLDELEKRFEGVSIKDCPKCKHPVLVYISRGISQDPLEYQCLTCGSEFTCSEKCVCELVKDG